MTVIQYPGHGTGILGADCTLFPRIVAVVVPVVSLLVGFFVTRFFDKHQQSKKMKKGLIGV